MSDHLLSQNDVLPELPLRLGSDQEQEIAEEPVAAQDPASSNPGDAAAMKIATSVHMARW